MILAIRTDTATAQLSLYAPNSAIPLQHLSIELGRAMARDLLTHLQALLAKAGIAWDGLSGVVVFQGPGSFTGLRIGATVADTIAYAQNVPIVGVEGADWAQQGVRRLQRGQNDRIVMPHYGQEAHITQPRK